MQRLTGMFEDCIRHCTRVIVIPFILLAFPIIGFADETSGTESQPEWSSFASGGYEHWFDTDIDNSGSFSIDRTIVRGGVTYARDYRRSVSISVGYTRDAYDFSGGRGFSGLRPWDDVNSYRIGMPVRWGFDRNWTLFVVPALRFSVESGGDLEDAVTGGGFAGFSYRFSDRLTLGPGIGVMSELEDSTSVFPALIVKWQITDRLTLQTGPSLAGTSGPGIGLKWDSGAKWDVSVGVRYKKLRFRLDDRGSAPEGIGQDRAFPLFWVAGYQVNDRIRLSFLGGAALSGELRLEDEDGHGIAEEDYDTAVFGGIAVDIRY